MSIFKSFPINDEEYLELDAKFEQLCKYQTWQLVKKNSNNHYVEDLDDYFQELRIKLLSAGSYYKRQVYIENCMKICGKHIKDVILKKILERLEYLWKNKTRHGANRQKFGEYQEKILDDLVIACVPKKEIPNKNLRLKIDGRFATYCKAITWNHQKTMGKKITREKSWRAGMVSLSDFDYLANL